MVHLTVAICDAGEVQRRLLQAKGSGFIRLTIPEKFKDIEVGLRPHGKSGSLEDGDNLMLGETIQELAHPDGILIFGE